MLDAANVEMLIEIVPYESNALVFIPELFQYPFHRAKNSRLNAKKAD